MLSLLAETAVEACCPTKETDNKRENFWKENESRHHISPSSTVMESKKAKQVSSVITRTNVRREGTFGIHPLSRPQPKFQQKVESTMSSFLFRLIFIHIITFSSLPLLVKSI